MLSEQRASIVSLDDTSVSGRFQPFAEGSEEMLAPLLKEGIRETLQKSPLPKSSQRTFRGRLEVFGLSPAMEEQVFIAIDTPEGLIIESDPTSEWPSFEIALVGHSLRDAQAIRGVRITQSNNTAQAEILYTRLIYALILDGTCRISDTDSNQTLKFRVRAREAASEDRWFPRRVMLCRKLRFIERCFGLEFSIPPNSTVGDERRVEMIFRGITEGEFIARQSNYTLYNYSPSADELSKPPFTSPGVLRANLAEWLPLYNRQLDVGRVDVRIGRAEVANRRKLKPLLSGEQESADLRFVVFDHQVRYRFEDYVNGSRPLKLSELEDFKRELSRDEPAELVMALTETLDGEVSAEEARQIAGGWLEYNRFPDRYCPQFPTLNGDVWEVPIRVTYPDGSSGWVTDVSIDLTTGNLTTPTPVEEMRLKGQAVAEKVLRGR